MSKQGYWSNKWRSSVVFSLVGGLCALPVSYAQVQQIEDKQGAHHVIIAHADATATITTASTLNIPKSAVSNTPVTAASTLAAAYNDFSNSAAEIYLAASSGPYSDTSNSFLEPQNRASQRVAKANASKIRNTQNDTTNPQNNTTNKVQAEAETHQTIVRTNASNLDSDNGDKAKVKAYKQSSGILCGSSQYQADDDIADVSETSFIKDLVKQVVQECNDRNGQVPTHNFTVEQLTLLRDCAIEQGDPLAQNAMGLLSLQGKYMRPSPYKAAIYFSMAAAQGNVDAQNNLGELYLNGQGVDQNTAIAVAWFEQAAAQGLCQAQYNLGRLYVEGRGVNQDLKYGFSLVKQAAEKGHALAQFFLGRLYIDGIGTKPDKDQAAQWFNKSCMQNVKQSCHIMEKLKLRVTL